MPALCFLAGMLGRLDLRETEMLDNDGETKEDEEAAAEVLDVSISDADSMINLVQPESMCSLTRCMSVCRKHRGHSTEALVFFFLLAGTCAEEDVAEAVAWADLLRRVILPPASG